MRRTTIIAEIGVNHDGYLTRAKKLIHDAKAAGADIVKFQVIDVEMLTVDLDERARLRKFDWDVDTGWMFRDLRDVAVEAGVEFLLTPHDPYGSLDLCLEMNLPQIKIGSGDLNNYDLLAKIAHSRRGVLLSTGMSTLAEVGQAVAYLHTLGCPSVKLLHCVSCYPTAWQDAKLRAIHTLGDIPFVDGVGYSDHTHSIVTPVLAVALGASIVEVHITDDHDREGPDHKASLDLVQFRRMVENVRFAETSISYWTTGLHPRLVIRPRGWDADMLHLLDRLPSLDHAGEAFPTEPSDYFQMLGDGSKTVQLCEQELRERARKSWTSARAIKAGETLKAEDVLIRRPGTGIPADVVFAPGSFTALRDIEADQVIFPSQISFQPPV